MNIIELAKKKYEEITNPKPKPTVTPQHQQSIQQSLSRGFQEFVKVAANQPLISTPGFFGQGGYKSKTTTGDAFNFLSDITFRPITRMAAEAQLSHYTKNNPNTSWTPKTGFEKLVLGDDPLMSYSNPNRPSRQLLRMTGMNETDVNKYAPFLIASGIALDATPLGADDLIKGGVKKLGKEGLEQTAKKKLVKEGVENVGKYLDDLPPMRIAIPGSYTNLTELDNPLATKAGREAIGKVANQADDFVESLKYRKKEQLVDEFARTMESKGTPIKKVNLLDYVRTPDRVLEKIGFGNEMKLLRSSYDNYVKELPSEIKKITAWSKRVPQNENVALFRWLDGRQSSQSLTPETLKVGMEIRSYLKEWAKKLGLPEDKQITAYITHIFPKNAIEKDIDPDIAKLIRSKVAGSVYDQFLQKRKGTEGFIEDTWQALQAYTKRAVRKSNLDPALEKISTKAENLENESFDYIKRYVANINMQPSAVDNLLDNLIKQSPVGYKLGSRPTTIITQSMRKAIFRGTLGLNVGSALRNLGQFSNSYAVLGEKYTLLGYMKLLTNRSDELQRVGVLGQDFIQDRTISATAQAMQKMDKGLFFMFDQVEKVNRGAAYWGAKSKALSKGMSETEAIEYAKNVVAKTQFLFSSIDSPVFLQSDLMKTATQLQGYTLKQIEFLSEMIMKDKNYAGLARYIAGTLFFTYTIGQAFGAKPEHAIPSVRFGVPSMQFPYGLFEAATKDRDQYGNELNLQDRVLNKNVVSGGFNYVPAGAQLKKTGQAIIDMNQGGNLTESGRLRYPVTGTSPILFGSNNSELGKEYYANKSKPLTDAQTERYYTMVNSGMAAETAYRTIRADQAKEQAFEDSIKPAEDKDIFDHFGDIWASLTGNKQAQQIDQTASTDPLLAALQEDKQMSETDLKIRKIFSSGLDKQGIEEILKDNNLGSYEDASLFMMKGLGVENGLRGRVIKEMLKPMDNNEYKKTVEWLADNGVLTTSVTKQWFESGEIDEQQRKAIETLIKRQKNPKYGYRKVKPLKVKVKKINVSVPKLQPKRLIIKKVAMPKITSLREVK